MAFDGCRAIHKVGRGHPDLFVSKEMEPLEDVMTRRSR